MTSTPAEQLRRAWFATLIERIRYDGSTYMIGRMGASTIFAERTGVTRGGDPAWSIFHRTRRAPGQQSSMHRKSRFATLVERRRSDGGAQMVGRMGDARIGAERSGQDWAGRPTWSVYFVPITGDEARLDTVAVSPAERNRLCAAERVAKRRAAKAANIGARA